MGSTSMRPTSFLLLAAAAMAPACVLAQKSPALSSPLRDRLAKQDTSHIEEVVRACLSEEGWTPDDVSGDAEGATVVKAKNKEKARTSVYIQSPGQVPRVTGDPAYDDPFWKCLNRDAVNGPAKKAAEPKSEDEP
jgi:hypothetical protein